MTLHPQESCMKKLGRLYTDPDFLELYPNCGQLARSPAYERFGDLNAVCRGTNRCQRENRLLPTGLGITRVKLRLFSRMTYGRVLCRSIFFEAHRATDLGLYRTFHGPGYYEFKKESILIIRGCDRLA